MRHLTTEELLLYAEGELEPRALCRHVTDCVDCKAQLVDVQESFVQAAAALRVTVHSAPEQPAQLHKLRERLAVEATLLSAHLSTEDLLLSVDGSPSPEARSHLHACAACQNRAADIHVQLAEIEVELHRQFAFELPVERRAAALAALRERLAHEVERKTAQAAGPSIWSWLPSFGLPRIPAFGAYAGSFAAVCLAAWLGLGDAFDPSVPTPESLARVAAPSAPSAAFELREESPALQGATVVARAARRFAGIPAAVRRQPAAPAVLAGARAPALAPALYRPDQLALTLTGPDIAPSPPFERSLPAASPVPAPGRLGPAPRDSLASVAQGSWMLARTGYWNQGLQAGGSDGRVRITGTVSSERERLAVERALLAAADGWPVEFSISQRAPRAVAGGTRAEIARQRQPGGLVRASLLRHYEDAARRSFQQLDRSLLASELDRYVSDVLRHDAEILAHVHALHALLNRPGVEEVRHTDSFRKVARFHLQGIADHEAGIYDRLSEALPRPFWAFRGASKNVQDRGSLGASSLELLRDALALDRSLNSLLFAGSEALDARESPLSSASLLSRVRQRTRWLKASIR